MADYKIYLNHYSWNYNNFYDFIGDANNALKGRNQNDANGLRPLRACMPACVHIHRALPCAIDVWLSAINGKI